MITKLTKPKRPQPKTPYEPQGRDDFQTPNYGIDLIAPYLSKDWKIWEPCSGRLEKIVTRLTDLGFNAFGTDLIHGGEYNALEYLPPCWWDCAVTNPPYSIKAEIIARFVALDKPFAMLINADWGLWLTDQFIKHGCQMLIPNRRIDFITPAGKEGKDSTAQFHSGWLTRKLNLPSAVTFCELSLEAKKNV